MSLKNRASTIKSSLKEQAVLLAAIIGAFYLIELVDFLIRAFSSGSLDALGIRPRTLSGLLGIPLAPLLHGGFGHLIANTIPFAILGWLVLLSGRKVFISATITIIIAGGIGVWIFGSNTVHIGASGVVYGFLGFVLVRAYLEKRLVWIVLAVAAGLVYSGLILGLFNVFKEGISWSSHFFGLAAGGLAAFIAYRKEDSKVETLPGKNRKADSNDQNSRRKPRPDPGGDTDDEVDIDALLEEFQESQDRKGRSSSS